MRRWAIAALAICGGCNWVFGLEETTASDPENPQFGFIQMSRLIGPADSGNQIDEVTTAPLPDPKGRYASLDGTFKPITYDAMMGRFPYPAELANVQWRFEYTLPGQVPREIQWKPAQGMGHIVVPEWGRIERARQNPNTGFVVEPPATFFAPGTEVFTTGYWTQTRVTGSPSTLSLDFSTLPPVSGELGATIKNDWVVSLGADTPLGDCFQRANIATLQLPDPIDKVMTSVRVVEESELDSAVIKYPMTTEIVPYGPFVTRLNNALGGDTPNTRKGTTDGKVYFGRVAHTELPLFTSTIDDGVPAPVMMPLVWCPLVTATDPTNFNVGLNLRWRLAAYAFIANDRMVGGVRLRSSITTITLKNGSSDDYLLDYPIKIAIEPKLGTADLDSGDDDQQIPETPADLTFNLEAVGHEVDYYEVTLYRVLATTLEPVRVYVGATKETSAAIRFDPAIMMPGEEYVFAIRTIRGRPAARNYDFRPVSMPQATATVFTKTFHR